MLAVIFTSTLKAGINQDDYQKTAALMERLVREIPGYSHHYSYRDETGQGVTISYFQNAQAAEAWKNHFEHQKAQKKGRETFYSAYQLDICQVTSHREWVFPG